MQRQIMLLQRAYPVAVALLAVALVLAGVWGPRITSRPAPVERQEAASPTQPAPRWGITTHIVAPGETISGIAARYGLDVDTILGANPGIDELIHPGDQLVILSGRGVLYTVTAGDTLWGIARQYGVSLDAILQANGKTDVDLAEGERLFIPGARPARTATAPSRGREAGWYGWPTRGSITSPYGYRWGRLHAGIDIANGSGTPVLATRRGRVVFAGWRGGYGYAVIIDHGQGVQSLYGHLEDFTVQAGDYVQRGQVIGYMGSTGYSTGPHLHFEVIVNGQPVDPLDLLP